MRSIQHGFQNHPLRWLAVFVAIALGSLLPLLAQARPKKADAGPWLDRVIVSGNLAVSARSIYAIVETLHLKQPDNWQAEAKKAVAALYESKGFPYADVVIETRTDRQALDVHVLVAEGPSFVIDTIRVQGYDSEEILERLSFEPGDPFSDAELSDNVEQLEAWFRSQGYLEMDKIQTAAAVPDDSRQVAIAMNISLGKKVQITFRNNIPKDARRKAKKSFRDDVLMGVVGAQKETFFGDMFAEESVEFLSAYYQQQGYKNASVTWILVEDEKTGNKRIVFNVAPGRVEKKSKRKIRVVPVHDEVTIESAASAAPGNRSRAR